MALMVRTLLMKRSSPIETRPPTLGSLSFTPA